MTPRPSHRVRSTGAETTPTAPVTIDAAIGAPTTTGAEEFDDTPVTTRMAHLDEPLIVRSPTPGPVTMTVGWLTDPALDTQQSTEPETEAERIEAKVVQPTEPPRPTPAHAEARTKTHRTRGRSRDR